ncbi:MAG: hypothetical protein K2X56_17010 [Mycobacterium pseudokansasii]|uniref:Low molecular weight antigen MTB12 n=1 Tax=Mycobacterium pseudokansasii TaxID=2341080 RepID=A0A498QRL3_9MYCO|nr:hypothetical protein [Mycobacterium pseudokansasii]MBY0389750.1 hypothetical protein [Mycobacterium pseudokansasii]VBA52889.1 Low molecular weight antigen MTB12 [Mycobacterium pseudokansasii]
MKSVATAAAVVAAIGAAAAGVTSIASESSAVNQVLPVVFGAPMPQDPAPAANLPTAAQLTSLLNSLADPSVSFTNKSDLVEGGIGGTEARLADHELKKAAKNGDLPLSFTVSNIQSADAGTATADVAVSGPKLTSPVTQNVTFVNQGSWMLSRSSAMELLQAAGH